MSYFKPVPAIGLLSFECLFFGTSHLSGKSSGVIVTRRRRIFSRGPITFPVMIPSVIF